VLFYWFAFMFTLYTLPSAILCLCKNQYIRASLWASAGLAMLIWWDGRYGWDMPMPLYIVLVGVGVIATAWRYSKRFRQTAVPPWTPPPDTTNVIPFVPASGRHGAQAARSGKATFKIIVANDFVADRG
jgi:hypothetical protein